MVYKIVWFPIDHEDHQITKGITSNANTANANNKDNNGLLTFQSLMNNLKDKIRKINPKNRNTNEDHRMNKIGSDSNRYLNRAPTANQTATTRN